MERGGEGRQGEGQFCEDDVKEEVRVGGRKKTCTKQLVRKKKRQKNNNKDYVYTTRKND